MLQAGIRVGSFRAPVPGPGIPSHGRLADSGSESSAPPPSPGNRHGVWPGAIMIQPRPGGPGSESAAAGRLCRARGSRVDSGSESSAPPPSPGNRGWRHDTGRDPSRQLPGAGAGPGDPELTRDLSRQRRRRVLATGDTGRRDPSRQLPLRRRCRARGSRVDSGCESSAPPSSPTGDTGRDPSRQLPGASAGPGAGSARPTVTLSRSLFRNRLRCDLKRMTRL